MPFVKRSDQGDVVAISKVPEEGFNEELPDDDPAVQHFILDVTQHKTEMTQSDLEFIRVVEDLVDLLVSKNYILFTELPEKAQEKLHNRRTLRGKLSTRLDLFSDDEGLI